MTYQIIEEPDGLRVFAVNNTTGKKYCFTPVDGMPDLSGDKELLYNDIGDLYLAETVDGSPIDMEEVEQVWDAVNKYWERKNNPNHPIN